MSESNGVSAFIDDGYTIDFFIRGEEGLYPPVRGKYRPMISTEILRSNDAVRKATDAAAGEVVLAQWMAKRIIEWDIKNRDGEDVPISPETIIKMNPRLSKKLHELVYSVSAPEKDPAKN